MRKVSVFLVLLLLAACVLTGASASAPRLVDDADLLTASEETTVLASLNSVSSDLDMDVVVVTVDSLEGKSARAYADDYYDYHNYSANGILLLISMAEREWYMTTTGAAINLVTDSEVDRIGDAFVSYLSSGSYCRAFMVYAESVRTYAVTGSTSEERTESLAEKPMEGWLICLAIGIVVGLIVVLILRGQLKSVRNQNAAANYVVPGSFALTGSYELFLYRNVTRTAKPQNNGSHSGSSGRSHGGGGGRF